MQPKHINYVLWVDGIGFSCSQAHAKHAAIRGHGNLTRPCDAHCKDTCGKRGCKDMRAKEDKLGQFSASMSVEQGADVNVGSNMQSGLLVKAKSTNSNRLGRAGL